MQATINDLLRCIPVHVYMCISTINYYANCYWAHVACLLQRLHWRGRKTLLSKNPALHRLPRGRVFRWFLLLPRCRNMYVLHIRTRPPPTSSGSLFYHFLRKPYRVVYASIITLMSLASYMHFIFYYYLLHTFCCRSGSKLQDKQGQ